MSIRDDLKALYEKTGDIRFATAIEALEKWNSEKKETRGAKKKWRERELIQLWASVQALIFEKKPAKKYVTDACKMLVKGEGWGYGVYEAGDEEEQKRVIITNWRRLNRLYNEADRLVRNNLQAKKSGNFYKHIFISRLHPGNKDFAERVRMERIEADKKFSEWMRKAAGNLRDK